MPEPSVPIYIRLEVDLAERLDDRAKREGVPRVSVIRKALESYLREENER